MSWVFLQELYHQKDPPRFRFTTTLTLRGFDRQALGGEVSLSLKLDSSRPLSFRRFGGEKPMNARLSMMMEVMRPLVPFDPWRWHSLPLIGACFRFSPPTKNPRDVCLTPKTEMKLGIWKKWWCHMHCGRSWSFDSSRYIATILWVFA